MWLWYFIHIEIIIRQDSETKCWWVNRMEILEIHVRTATATAQNQQQHHQSTFSYPPCFYKLWEFQFKEGKFVYFFNWNFPSHFWCSFMLYCSDTFYFGAFDVNRHFPQFPQSIWLCVFVERSKCFEFPVNRQDNRTKKLEYHLHYVIGLDRGVAYDLACFIVVECVRVVSSHPH